MNLREREWGNEITQGEREKIREKERRKRTKKERKNKRKRKKIRERERKKVRVALFEEKEMNGSGNRKVAFH